MNDRPDLHFHYSREQRLSMPNAPDLAMRGKKGILKGNRSLVILLVDVLLIFILFVVYRYFFYRPSYIGDLSEYTVTLRGMAVSDRVIASVRVARRQESVTQAEPGRVYVRFLLKDEEIRLSEELPTIRGAAVELTASLLIPGKGQQLHAEVQIGDKTINLERRLERD
jgi:hypothetical protein